MNTISPFSSYFSVPIQEILTFHEVTLCMKREDLIHSGISGNKFWKLYHNIENYRLKHPSNPFIITFGGAFSNHIVATAYAGKIANIPTLGIIRGEELEANFTENPSLALASSLGMEFQFVSREAYRDKKNIEKGWMAHYPDAIIIPEGGTNLAAVEGIKNMLNTSTKDFDYLCTAVGTGGTVSGLSKYAEEHQKILGFQVVEDPSIVQVIHDLSGRDNVQLFTTEPKGYGKFDEKLIAFINEFYQKYQIPLDPIYTGKMMMKLFELIENDYFVPKTKILAFHTGGIQGVLGANQLLKKKKKLTIDFNPLQI